MPGSILTADIALPQDSDKNVEKQISELKNYVYMLLENLRFVLSNLGQENFNEKALSDMGKVITNPLRVQIENVQEDIAGISFSVTNGERTSYFTMKVGETEIKSPQIKFDGMVTFDNLTDGKTVIDGGNIKTGTISGRNLNGCTFRCYFDGSQKSGEIMLIEGNEKNGKVIGGIYADDTGMGTIENAKKRMFIYTNSGYVLKIYANDNISIETYTGDLYLRSTYGGVQINCGGNINLWPGRDVYINGKRVLTEADLPGLNVPTTGNE